MYSNLFKCLSEAALYKHFANESEVAALAERYQQGIGWGEAKQTLFEKMDEVLTPMREKYEYLLANRYISDEHLADGAKKARVEAKQLQTRILKRVKKGSTVFSDTWRGYTGIAAKGYVHRLVEHSKNSYVTNGNHINGLEGFWG